MADLKIPVFIVADPHSHYLRYLRTARQNFPPVNTIWIPSPYRAREINALLAHRDFGIPEPRLYPADDQNFEGALKFLPSFMDVAADIHITAKQIPRCTRSFGHLYYPAEQVHGTELEWAAAVLTLQVITQYLYARQLAATDFRAYYDRIRDRVMTTSYRVGRRRYHLRELNLPVVYEKNRDAPRAQRMLPDWLRQWLAAEYTRCVQDLPNPIDRVQCNTNRGSDLIGDLGRLIGGGGLQGKTTFYIVSGFYPWLLLRASSLLREQVPLVSCPGCQHVTVRRRRNQQSCNDTCRKQAARNRQAHSTPEDAT